MDSPMSCSHYCVAMRASEINLVAFRSMWRIFVLVLGAGNLFPNLHMGIGDRHGDMSDLFISHCESVLIGLRTRYSVHSNDSYFVYDQLPTITNAVSGRLRAKSESSPTASYPLLIAKMKQNAG